MEPLQTAVPQKVNILGRITNLYLCLMLTVYLFCFDQTGYLHIVELKQKAFWLICGSYPLAIAVALSVTVLQKKCTIRQVGSKLLPSTAAQTLALLFALFCILSTVFSQYPRHTLLGGSRGEGLLTILLYILIYYLVSKFFTPEKWLLWVLSGAVTVFSVLCILQLQGLNPLGLYPKDMTYFGKDTAYSGAYLGTIGNVGLVSAFLCLVIPFLCSMLVKRKLKSSHFLLLPLLLALYVLVKMSVMAGFVGVLGGILLSLPPCFSRKKTRRMIWLVLFGLVLVFCLVLYLFDFEFELFHELHLLLRGKLPDSAGSGRIFIWKNVIKRVPERLLFGHGADTMVLSDMPPFERYDPVAGKLLLGYNDAAHNEYLNLLYHHGIFALLAYLATVSTLLFGWIRKSQKNTLTYVMGCAVVGYLLQAFFGISQLITAPYFWIALGILEASMKSPSCSLNL